MNKSSVIMSEFAGCARNIGGVHLINPYDIEAISQAITTVIDTKAEEKKERME